LVDKTIPKSDLISKFRSEKWSMWSLKQGLQQLPETLNQHLTKTAAADICLQTPCTGLEFLKDGARVLHF